MTPITYSSIIQKIQFLPVLACTAFFAWSLPLQADPPPGVWTPTFTEDFNGSSLNTAIWNTGMRWGGAIKTEPQAYRPENVTVGSGVCTITASVKYGRINHSGGYAVNAATLDVDGFTFALTNNSYVRIGDKKYKILSSVGGTTPTQITIERAASLPAGTGLVAPVADNALVMAAVPIQNGSGFETDAMSFRSGAIQTYKKWQQTYGYFEARVKMPSGKGTWPAFWLLPDRVAYGTDEYARTAVGDLVTYGDSNAANDITVPMGNEIDIFEHMATWKSPSTGLSKSHHGYFWGYSGGESYGNWGIATEVPSLTWFTYPNPDTQFHTFGVYWAPGELRYYIDGTMVFRRSHAPTIAVCPHYMILNVALSHDDWAGQFPTDEDMVAGMPSTMQIDYVKVWSGTADSQFVEMEDVATAVSSDALTVYDDVSAGGRKAEKLASNADGDYATYTIPVAQPGTYNIKLRYKTLDARGRFQLSIDGVNQGSEVDEYSATSAQAEVDLGSKTFPTAGNKNFTFTVTGKTAGSINRELTFDYLTLVPSAVATEITMDSESVSGVTLTGTWSPSTTTPGYLGSNYLTDGNTSKGSKSVKFTPALTAAGNYQVFMRWTSLSNRATNVPVDIVKSDGTTATVTVNQTSNNGVWMNLGTYALSPVNASVTIRTTATDGYVIADGMRFTPQ